MIPKSIYVYLGVAILLFLGFWYHGERRFSDGVASRDAEVANLNSQVANAAVLLNQCDASSKANAAAAEAQRHMANAALDAATQRDKGRTRELADAVNKLNAARKTVDCKATSEALLCEAMAGY